MACTANKVPLFRTLAARGYASQPAVAAAVKGLDAQTTTLPNKMVVSSIETGSAISRVSIAFRAGARNETYETQGASHLLRIAAGLSTKHATGFGITRSIQQIGGSLSVTSDREIIAYTIEVTRDNLEPALKFLESAVTGQIFKPWEIEDCLPRLKVDLANVSAQVRAVEMLHRAAYRTGLGNSMFCPKYRVGKISSETLQHFYASNFTGSRSAVAGINVDQQVLSGFAQSLGLESGEGTKNDCKYRGGTDRRSEKGGNMSSVAVGTNAGSWANASEALAYAILQRAAGTIPATKRGANNGTLTKSVQSAAPNTAVTALNATYSDNGLFGFVVSGPSTEVGKAVEAGVKAMKSGSLSDEDIARGKAGVKSDIAFAMETESSLIESMVGQSVLLGNVWTLKAALDAVDSVSNADVTSAARKLSAEKITVAAIGNLEHIPYAADLN
ncbi:unnamed protein product [Diamesa hyperborea]